MKNGIKPFCFEVMIKIIFCRVDEASSLDGVHGNGSTVDRKRGDLVDGKRCVLLHDSILVVLDGGVRKLTFRRNAGRGSTGWSAPCISASTRFFDGEVKSTERRIWLFTTQGVKSRAPLAFVNSSFKVVAIVLGPIGLGTVGLGTIGLGRTVLRIVGIRWMGSLGDDTR